MDRASLAARIQDILKTRDGRTDRPVAPPVPLVPSSDGGGGQAGPSLGGGVDEEAAFAIRCAAAEASSRALDVLGGTIVDSAKGPCVVVDRHYPARHRHGRHRVDWLSNAARQSAVNLPWFLQGSGGIGSDAGSLFFFDLETTGLSGGAGTYAFLVGCGFFDGDGFHTRQFFLRGYGEERALLCAVEDEIRPGAEDPPAAGVAGGTGPQSRLVVTYNGRSFDLPLIETRYQLHRLPSPFGGMPHLDMLYPARRLWRRRPTRRAASGAEGSAARIRADVTAARDEVPGSCALTAIERDILGLERHDDVPGWEIPSRYFAYARSGDASGLAAVFEHNRLDVMSLAAVTAVVLDMVREGADAARERHDCLALGRLFEYLGRLDEAERCYVAATSRDGTLDVELDRVVRGEALRWLAVHWRRSRRFQEAAEAWHELAEVGGLDAEVHREALEALAIHHEHRAKDLAAARTFTLRALDLAGDARRVDEVRHRLGRLSRKIGRPGG